MKLAEILFNEVQKCIIEVYGLQADTDFKSIISIQSTRPEFEGDATLVVFALTKISKQSPELTANTIGTWLQANLPQLETFNVVKGFLNLKFNDAYWLSVFTDIATVENYGQFPAKNERVMVEYSSPNTNKPLHLGHVRNNLLGAAMANILAAYGYDVIKANLINDRGIHICKSMVAWQLFANGETPETNQTKGDKLVGKYYVAYNTAFEEEFKVMTDSGIDKDIAEKTAPILLKAQAMLQDWEAGNEEVMSLWKTMNEWVYKGFDETYKALGVSFDKYYYESNTYLLGKDIVKEGLAKNIFTLAENGAVQIDLTAEGLDSKVVQRADGTSVYITQDLGTAKLKYEDFKMQKSIYVVGNEQDYHFKVLFLILEKMGYTWAKGLHHLSYGMVLLPNGKMKSREGNVVDADDLVAEMINTAKENTEALGKVDNFSKEEKETLYETIGLGAMKYYLLKIDAKKQIMFNPLESIDLQGHTGPFIQYTYARIKSIIRKADATPSYNFNINEINAAEKKLIMLMADFNTIIAEAAEEYSPAPLANYLYELAKTYNQFYHECPIMIEPDADVKNLRLALSVKSSEILNFGLGLLGIAAPERM